MPVSWRSSVAVISPMNVRITPTNNTPVAACVFRYFRIRQTINGKPQGEVKYSQVQFNLPLGEELFKMPK